MLYNGSLGLGHGMEAYVIGRVERERERGGERERFEEYVFLESIYILSPCWVLEDFLLK